MMATKKTKATPRKPPPVVSAAVRRALQNATSVVRAEHEATARKLHRLLAGVTGPDGLRGPPGRCLASGPYPDGRLTGGRVAYRVELNGAGTLMLVEGSLYGDDHDVRPKIVPAAWAAMRKILRTQRILDTLSEAANAAQEVVRGR